MWMSKVGYYGMVETILNLWRNPKFGSFFFFFCDYGSITTEYEVFEAGDEQQKKMKQLFEYVISIFKYLTA